MELFHKNGHLTDEGLRALTKNQLDELQRLEAAEHLSFCDACLLHYTTLLEDNAVLLAPATPMKEPVLQRIRRRGRRILFSKYTTVAAAAVLVVVMWSMGLATSPLRPTTKPNDGVSSSAGEAPAARTTAADWLNEQARMLNGALDGFVSGLSAGEQQDEAAQRAEERKKKESVFTSREPEEDKQANSGAENKKTQSNSAS